MMLIINLQDVQFSVDRTKETRKYPCLRRVENVDFLKIILLSVTINVDFLKL